MEANAQKISDYGTYLGAEAAYNLPRIKDYTEKYALKTDFMGKGTLGNCILQPLADEIRDVAVPAVDGLFKAAEWGLAELGDAFGDVAGTIDKTEDSNAHLFYSFHLDGDHPRDAKGEEYYRGGGTAFPIAQLKLDPPSAGDGGGHDVTDKLKGDAKTIVDVADWLMEKWNEVAGTLKLGAKFPAPPGQPPTFENLVIDPILGDANAINANGDACKIALGEGGLAAIVTQMGDNLTTLTYSSGDWSGPAADAAKAFVDNYWKKVVQIAAENVGGVLADGFNKIGTALSTLCARLVEEIFKLISFVAEHLAGKIIKSADLPEMILEEGAKLIWKWVGGHVETIVDDIKAVIKIIDGLFNAYRAMQAMIDAAKKYLDLFDELKGAFQAIPEIKDIKSGADFTTQVAGMAKDLPGGDRFEKLEKGGATVASAAQQYNDAKGKLDKAEDRYPEAKDGHQAPPKAEPAPTPKQPLNMADYTPLQGPYKNPRTGRYETAYKRKDGTGPLVYESDFTAPCN